MKNLNLKNLEIKKLVLNISRNENVPEDLLPALVDWKEKKYLISKIASKNDISRLAREKKVFVIPKRNPKKIFVKIFFGVLGISFLMSFSLLFYFQFQGINNWRIILFCFILLMKLFLPTLIVIGYDFKKFKFHYVIIGPNGVLYTKSRKYYGYFSWNSINDVRKIKSSEGPFIAGDPEYVQCNFLTEQQKEKNHKLIYLDLNENELPNFELFYNLVYHYWISFREKTLSSNVKPEINIHYRIGLLIFLLGYIVVIWIVLVILITFLL